MVNKRGREEVRAGAWRVFLCVLRVAQRGVLCVYGMSQDEAHGVMFVSTLWRLRRYFFVY